MIRPIYRLPALLLVAAGALAAQPVYAHGFGERYDLPVPLEYYLLGAAATVALSFVVIGVFCERRAGGCTGTGATISLAFARLRRCSRAAPSSSQRRRPRSFSSYW